METETKTEKQRDRENATRYHMGRITVETRAQTVTDATSSGGILTRDRQQQDKLTDSSGDQLVLKVPCHGRLTSSVHNARPPSPKVEH